MSNEENKQRNEVVKILTLLSIGMILGGMLYAGWGERLDQSKSNPSQCYMTNSNGTCLVDLANNFPEPYTKHCTTQSGRTNESDVCIITDGDAEQYSLFRPDQNSSIQVSKNIRSVDQDINESGYGTVYLSDFYEVVENQSISAEDHYQSLEEFYKGRIDFKVNSSR